MLYLNNLLMSSQDSSVLWKWPSLQPHFTGSGIRKIQIRMFAFGATTNKPLSFRGTWKGLHILRTGDGPTHVQS